MSVNQSNYVIDIGGTSVLIFPKSKRRWKAFKTQSSIASNGDKRHSLKHNIIFHMFTKTVFQVFASDTTSSNLRKLSFIPDKMNK